nr:hypothetical protein [uncultured Niameybacter sp.]
MKKYNKSLAKILCFGLTVVSLTSTVRANEWTGSDNSDKVFVPEMNGTYRFNKNNPTVQKEGYYTLYKDTLFHKVTYGDTVPVSVYLPTDVPEIIGKYTSGPAGSLIKRYVKANTRNVAGKGGEHLISSNDWNAKKGQVEDVSTSAGYKGDNTGFVDINGYKGELRYIGYLSDGSQVDNPYFPNDISNNKNPWDKDWKYFGVQTASGKNRY